MFIKKLNKRQLALISIGILGIAPICFFAAVTVSAENLDPASCGKSSDITFGFNDVYHTQFIIPEEYLDDPYQVFHKVKNPAELISIRVKKSTFGPKCNHAIGKLNEDIQITIRPSDKNKFALIRESHQRIFTKDNGVESNIFNLSTNNYPANKKWERRDFLVPIDNNLKDKIFFECSYALPSSRTHTRVGCKVSAEITDTVYVTYTIAAADLENYSSIQKKVKDLVLSFIVNEREKR